MEGGVATCGLGELFGGGVDSAVMEEDPEEEGPRESTIIHLKFIFKLCVSNSDIMWPYGTCGT